MHTVSQEMLLTMRMEFCTNKHQQLSNTSENGGSGQMMKETRRITDPVANCKDRNWTNNIYVVKYSRNECL